MKKLVLGLALMLLGVQLPAHNNVVVIPMGAAKPANLIIVAPQGGDFSDPVAAVNSISDAAADKRYTVFVMPGTYELSSTLEMRPYIDLLGSGRDPADPDRLTKLKGAVAGTQYDGSSALVVAADLSGIQSLMIENSGISSDICIALYIDTGAPVLSDLNLTCSGARVDLGIMNRDGSPSLSHVNIEIHDPSATGGNIAMRSDGGNAMLVKHSNFSAYYSAFNYAILDNGTDNNVMQIFNSNISGGSASVILEYNNPGAVIAIENSFLTGGVQANSGTITCYASVSIIPVPVMVDGLCARTLPPPP